VTGGRPVDLLAATGNAAWETGLVARLSGRAEIRIARRCVDLPDLLATAATSVAHAAVVGPDLHRLDRDAVARLAEHRLVVLGMAPADDDQGRSRLAAIGVPLVLDAQAGADEVLAAVTSLRSTVATGATSNGHHAADGDQPIAVLGTQPRSESPDADGQVAATGRLVAVWGPTGAPGRTTVAVNLAVEAARLGVPTLLADADTYGASIAQVLGILDEAPGLAALVRRAATAAPTVDDVVRNARQVEPRLRVLTGLARADRWPELRPAALSAVWKVSRRAADLVVVDLGFSLEQREEITFDVAAPRRNASTLVTLEAADLVIAVGTADPLGVQRLIRGVDDLRTVVDGAHIMVVVNRSRRSLPGGDREVRQLLARHASIDDVVVIAEDRPGLDAAISTGRALADAAPRSPARAALRNLAGEVLRTTLPPGRRGSARQSRRRR
jgi:MinD-like ATPase involved in chromosome partitioning or flagellar assembly